MASTAAKSPVSWLNKTVASLPNHIRKFLTNIPKQTQFFILSSLKSEGLYFALC